VAEAGLTVQIFEGASQIGQATAAGDGSWHASVTLANEGVNAIIASASDAATNTSYSNTVVYTLDTVAPIISITSPGGTTNQPVQTITGVTEPGVGVIVQLYDGAVPIAQATASGDGHWSASVTLNQGANVLTATTMDAAGNTGASNAITYTVSTATPTVTSIAATPTTGDLAAGASVKFTIGVSQAVTVSGVPQISLNDGGAALYSASLSTPTSLVFVYTVAPGQQSADLRSTALALPSGASIMDAYGNALAGSVAFDTRLQVDAPAVTGVAVATNPSGLLALRAGQTVTLTVSLSEAVTVTGKPQLVLNDGGVAKYLSGSGTNALTFSYQVASGQNVADLVVSSFNLNGGSIKAAPGSAHNVADLSGAVGTDTHLQIDTLAPVVLSEATNPGSGDLAAGATIAITVTMSEAVIVTGAPTLKLNDGGVASFDAARSTARALAFNYIVKPGDNTPDLAITAMTLNGGAVQDIAGNAATLSGAAINPAGVLQIDTKTPTVTSVTTNPASGSLGAGKLVKLTVNMSEAVTVNGAPVLQLNVGETATYDAGLSSSTALVFDYTVKAGDNTPDLKVSGVSLNGGGVQDLASNAANLAGAVANPAGVLAIDTTPPISLLKTVGTGTSPVLGGTTEASSALSLSYVDLATGSAGQLGTTTADGSGGWSLATNGGWYHSADGVEVKISATDTAGNVGVTNTFWGTTGADTFASTASADYFVGNGASDTFVFSNGMAGGAGQDVIKDFGAHLVKAKAQADVVEFDNVFSSFASLFASAHNNAAGAAEIDYMSGGVASSLTLLGVSASQLTASDFKLVNG
jgi:DNA/RNA endonuclease YhcR with UshA esterase domain